MESAANQVALGAGLAKLSFIARHADEVVGSSWYEAVCSNLLLTDETDEALGVPLTTAVFVLLHS